MKIYQCKHVVEAMQWLDTDEKRLAFTVWFEGHDKMFVTRGPVALLPEEGEVTEGEWILWSDGEFIAMEDDLFVYDYKEVAG